MKETDVQRAILDYLSLKRHFCWRNNSGAFKTEHGSFLRAGLKGSADIVCCIDGQFVGIEVKGPKGKLSPAQEAFRDMLTDAGGKYVEARSIDDVMAAGL